MKEKILQDLKTIDVVELLKLKEKTDLVDSGSVFDIKIAENSTTIILDLVPLDLNKDEAKIIEELILKKLEKPKFFFKKSQKFNVIFTSNKKKIICISNGRKTR